MKKKCAGIEENDIGVCHGFLKPRSLPNVLII